MTPEQRAEARRLLTQNGVSHSVVLATAFERLVPKLLDALDAAERERDTARAQVKTLAATLLKISDNSHEGRQGRCGLGDELCHGCAAITALKAAGVEP